MLPYFLVTGVIVFMAVLFPKERPDRMAWYGSFTLLVGFIGLRHHVGMDWNNYLYMSNAMIERSLWQAMDIAEPAYALLLWTSTQLGLGIYGVNLVGSAIFCVGLFKVAQRTPMPWLALAVAMPMLVIVVSMSANRQALAIGVLLWLVAVWNDSGVRRRVLLTLLASLFHFSAAFFLIFVAWDIKMRRAYRVLLGLALAIAMVFYLQYSGAAEYYDALYLSGQSQLTYSPGASQHVLFNGLPALAVFLRRRIRDKLLPSALLVQMGYLALALIPLSFFFSAASGRMTLYMFPVSIFVLSGLPPLLRGRSTRAFFRTFIGLFMVAVLGYWLMFANSSRAHIPYQNVLLT